MPLLEGTSARLFHINAFAFIMAAALMFLLNESIVVISSKGQIIPPKHTHTIGTSPIPSLIPNLFSPEISDAPEQDANRSHTPEGSCCSA